MIKYRTIFENIAGQTIRADIDIAGYDGSIIQVDALNDAPVTIERNGEIFGIMGTSCSLRLINEGAINPLDFLVSEQTDCKLTLYVNDVVEFIGAIVLDDVTTALQATPYELELTFTDNLGLLEDVEAPFIIDNEFTSGISVIRTMLAQTGLTLPLNIFHAPYVVNDTTGAFEQFQILPRTFAISLREFDRSKDALNKLLYAFRSRLFQHRGEWYIIRVYDYMYDLTTFDGFRYDGSNVGVAGTLTVAGEVVEPVQFSQSITYQRPASRVSNQYNFDAGFQLFNADLQELGSLVSTTVVGDTTVERYNIPNYWFTDGSATAFIEVVYETATDTEVDRYIIIPYLSAAASNLAGLRFNKILVSEGDTFQMTVSHRAKSNTNFALRFSWSVFLEGVSGQNYAMPDTLAQGFGQGFQTTVLLPSTAPTINNREVAGRFDNLEKTNQQMLPYGDSYTVRFPEDGFLSIKLAGYKNNDSRLADLDCLVDDIQFDYEFLVNKKTSIEAQNHTSETGDESKNIREQEYFFDQSIKFNPIGQLYALDDTILGGWSWPDGGSDEIPIGELNNIEEAKFFGTAKTQVDGIFDGYAWPGQTVVVDGVTYLVIGQAIDYRNNKCNLTLISLDENPTGTYNFEYLYKVRG